MLWNSKKNIRLSEPFFLKQGYKKRKMLRHGFLFFVILMRFKKIICKSYNYKKKYAIPFFIHLWMYNTVYTIKSVNLMRCLFKEGTKISCCRRRKVGTGTVSCSPIFSSLASQTQIFSHAASAPKSIYCTIEDQAFSLSYVLAPSSPLPPVSCLSFSVFLCVAGQAHR
jgi:hypothetical protein